jgi:hypothetical protein
VIRRIEGLELPPVWRVSWVSPAARRVWEPRLEALRAGNVDRVLAVLQSGRLEVAALAVAPDRMLHVRRRVEAAGFAFECAGDAGAGVLPAYVPSRYGTSRAPAELLLAGARVAVAEAAEALAAGDSWPYEALLGVPECCADAHAQRLDGWLSPWWPMAAGTSAPRVVRGGYAAVVEAGPPATLLLNELRIAWLWWAPCRFDCPATAAAADELGAATDVWAAARQSLDAIQRWPVEWSALHGLAELKTPVLKLATNTDPTMEKLIVHVRARADAEPVEAAARGVRFPFVVHRQLAGRPIRARVRARP